MARYWRIRLGISSANAEDALEQGFIGLDFGISQDTAAAFPDDWAALNRRPLIDELILQEPNKTRTSAGLALGQTWTLCHGIAVGDWVIAPTSMGDYQVGQVSGPYFYAQGQELPHRRPVQWQDRRLTLDVLSEAVQRAAKVPLTLVVLEPTDDDIQLVSTGATTGSPATAAGSPSVFAMEMHLEDFIVRNWDHTHFGHEYRIAVDENGAAIGKQYPIDGGKIDILAEKKDGTEYLVIELKRGSTSDEVVGQTLRYMGSVRELLATPEQSVRGAIIALGNDFKVQRALSMTTGIDFYRYEVDFKLHKQN